jgi:hypothetical protein
LSEAVQERKRASGVLELRAIRDLTRAGWTPEEIALDRGFSLRTFYRRLERLAKLEAKLRPGVCR